MENKELETWLKETKAKNLSLEELEILIVNYDLTDEGIFYSLNGVTIKEKAQILFNQWQQETEFSPKIIGYKAPFDLFNGYIKKGHLFIEWSRKHYYSAVNENVSNYSLPKEIVETWEPEFEPLPTEQPTETDFKSQAIELMQKEIIIAKNNLSSVLEDKLYNDAAMWENDIRTLQKLLNQIKQLC